MNSVVVTGIGLATALGLGREKTWGALCREESGIQQDAVRPELLSARIPGFGVPDETRLLSMAFLAAAEALQDSNLDLNLIDRERFGCNVSVSKPNLALLKTQSNFFSEAFFPYEPSRQLYKIFKLRGPVQNITAACATGTNSPILAAQWIRHGVCDLVLAGAVESSLHPLYFAGFDQMGVLARSVVCPFDKRRQGFALGEGAGIFVLERKDHALMRGARIYGEITGWAMANDASHAVAFGRSGSVIAEAIARALQRAGRDRVDYINAHGTATPLNDIIETRAIKKAFGARAGSISLSSTKAATGHLLGASGAVEFAFSLLALRDQIIPPTLNLCEPDSECDLDYTPQHVRMATVESVMSLSFGFGGQIGVIAATR